MSNSLNCEKGSNKVLHNSYYISFGNINGKSSEISALKTLSADEYNRISPDLLRKIRKESVECLYNENNKAKSIEIEKVHDEVSDLMIDKLNKVYGENNWTLISLGRSVSSIADVIGYKVGNDKVKHIPMSKSKKYLDQKNIDMLEGTEDLECFNNYLTNIGLDKDNMSDSNHHFVVVDYCHTGGSLLAGYNLLTSKAVFDNTENIHMVNVMDFIPQESPLYETLYDYLYHANFKGLSFVDKCTSLAETGKSFITPNDMTEYDRYMKFKLLDNVMQSEKYNT